MPSAGWVDDFFFFSRKDFKRLSLLEQPVPAPVDQSRHSLLCGSSGHGGISHGDVMILLYEKCGEDDDFFHTSINIKVKEWNK